jgi:hypothetical protein
MTLRPDPATHGEYLAIRPRVSEVVQFVSVD